MKYKNILNSAKGFTLLEAVIAVLLLAAGILGVATMQIQAIQANGNGNDRTRANAIAKSFIEELRLLDFGDAQLADIKTSTAGGKLNDGSADGGGAVDPTLAEHRFVAANFPDFANIYTVSGNDLVGENGKAYQLFWNIDKDPWGDGVAHYCVISLYMYWQSTSMGQQHLHLTTVKND